MQISVTPTQFSTLEEKLSVQHGVTVSPTSDMAGTVTTPDVTISYVYDGTANMDVEVPERHSFLARHASESTVEGHVRDFLAKAIQPPSSPPSPSPSA